MAELSFLLGVVVVSAGLILGVAAYRRRRVAVVYREEGERLVELAQLSIIGGVILAFVVFMIVNDR